MTLSMITGDINNSRQFAKDLTVNIKEVMDEKLKDAFSEILPATDKKRQTESLDITNLGTCS